MECEAEQTENKRAYRQGARAEQSEANTQRVLSVAVLLMRTAPKISGVTLEEIAAGSGVTVRTILRRFGTRDNLLAAAFEALKNEFESHRKPVAPGDIEGALDSLLGHYESDGDLNIRALEQERELDLVHQILEYGRHYHREWVRHVFGPRLRNLKPGERKQCELELYAATDVYLWKLLRRDLGCSEESTVKTLRRLVNAVLAQYGQGF